jgi:hypothetical protein
MSTRYTAKLVEEGQTFQEFALGCARAFGALISMRDDASDVPIPDEFVPSDYHEKQLAEAQAHLAELQEMSWEEREALGQAEKEKDIDSAENSLLRELGQNTKIDEMLANVKAWHPPTGEHQGLKDFMLQQLEMSYNSTKYIREMINELDGKFPRDYYLSVVAQARRNIEYHTEEHAKEVKRASERTAWVRQLKESLR